MAERQAGSVLETRPRREETVDLMRAHDIRDIKVRNPEGENLGDISDVAIDRDSGCVAYAVLSYGGILGFGEKHFAIPWEAVRTRPGERSAVVDADKRTLDTTHGFARDRMPREGDWSLIRTPPPARAAAAAAPAETTAPGRERTVPTPPPVQTVAGGWGGQPTGQRAEEPPVTTEAPPREPGVREVQRERTGGMETRPVTEAERPTTTPGPAPGHLSAAGLQTYLKGIDYPAGRQDLINHARKNQAPESVITVLEGFSDRSYRSAAEVSEEFGSEIRGGRPARAETMVEEVREEPPVTRRAGAPSLAHLSAADLQVYLKGMDYPAGKQDLIAHARTNNAPEDVITALERFGDRTYRSAADVGTEFGQVR